MLLFLAVRAVFWPSARLFLFWVAFVILPDSFFIIRAYITVRAAPDPSFIIPLAFSLD